MHTVCCFIDKGVIQAKPLYTMNLDIQHDFSPCTRNHVVWRFDCRISQDLNKQPKVNSLINQIRVYSIKIVKNSIHNTCMYMYFSQMFIPNFSNLNQFPVYKYGEATRVKSYFLLYKYINLITENHIKHLVQKRHIQMHHKQEY